MSTHNPLGHRPHIKHAEAFNENPENVFFFFFYIRYEENNK